MQISAMMLTAALTMFGTQNMTAASDGSSIVVPDCVVLAIHDGDVPANLPAQQGGVLRTVNVKAGDQVKKGDVLATVDDEQEKLNLDVSQQRLVLAQAEADNNVNERYARAAAGVYHYRAQMVSEAIEKVPDAYSKSEVATYLLQAQQYDLQTEQAIHEQRLAKLGAKVREAELKLAEYELARRQIKAPVDGVIEEVKQLEGSWVRAGDPVVRLIQMDRLKINGRFNYGSLTPADVRGKPVVVTVPLARGQTGQFKGQVDSTSSDYSAGQIAILVEVINQKDPQTGDWQLMPGMRGEMHIQGVSPQ